MNRDKQRLKAILAVMLTGLLVLFPVGCDSDSSAGVTADEIYNPIIDPANFVTTIDNQYLPLMPGTVFIYQGQTEDGIEENTIYVTHQTREILGVTCTVVRDRIWVDDELVEETFDWFSQDNEGNVFRI